MTGGCSIGAPICGGICGCGCPWGICGGGCIPICGCCGAICCGPIPSTSCATVVLGGCISSLAMRSRIMPAITAFCGSIRPVWAMLANCFLLYLIASALISWIPGIMIHPCSCCTRPDQSGHHQRNNQLSAHPCMSYQDPPQLPVGTWVVDT